MATITLQIPNSQIGWFEQMVRTMGWVFHREDTADDVNDNYITPELRRNIDQARQEHAAGKTIVCATPEAMQQYFDSL